MLDQAFQKSEIGNHAADPELAQSAQHAVRHLVSAITPGGDLDQKRVVEAGYAGAGIGGARIQPDAEAGRAAVGRDRSIVRDEAVLRIFSRDAALHSLPVHHDSVLRGHA